LLPFLRFSRKVAYFVFDLLGRKVPDRYQDYFFVRREAIWHGIGYKGRPYYGDVTLIRSRHRKDSSEGELFGWNEVVKGKIEVVEIPGRHEEIFDEPNVRELAERLNESLGEARSKTESVQ